MDQVVYGNLQEEGLEVVLRKGHYFVRYDAGAHQTVWREDQITESEFRLIAIGGELEQKTLLQLQKRLKQLGVDPYVQNWLPK